MEPRGPFNTTQFGALSLVLPRRKKRRLKRSSFGRRSHDDDVMLEVSWASHISTTTYVVAVPIVDKMVETAIWYVKSSMSIKFGEFLPRQWSDRVLSDECEGLASPVN